MRPVVHRWIVHRDWRADCWMELSFIVVGEAEVYEAYGFDSLTYWQSRGYRVYGVADSFEELDQLYQLACAEVTP